MPEISRFFGIVVQMYYDDHEPPHFHVRYSGQKALIEIETLALLRGRLSPRALGLVVERPARHRAELIEGLESRKGRGAVEAYRASGVNMLRDIVAASSLGDYRLHLRF